MLCNNIHTSRTLPSLLSSCASTVFLCTWATLHLDIPKDPGESWRASLWRRSGWTILALLAPEFILFRAYDDWSTGSRYLINLLEKHPECVWTETHALFASMGGFQLLDSDGTKKHLSRKEFFNLVDEEQINVPKISLLEIQDKSKGDSVAKTIAAIQTIWFLLQTINRAVQHLPVTELELTTVAYVVMYLSICFCWWNKPLDVKVPIYVRLKEGKRKTDQPQQGQKEEGKASEGSAGNKNQLLRKDGEAEATNDTTPDTQVSQGLNVTPLEHDVESQKPLLSQLPTLSLRVKLGASKQGTLTSWEFLGMMLFYFIGGGVFGAIHCIAWNWSKPGTTIRHLWRFSAVFVTVSPGALVIFSAVPPLQLVMGIFVLVYIVSRMSLLVLTFQALRSLPFEAYVTPSWTVYIPHIG